MVASLTTTSHAVICLCATIVSGRLKNNFAYCYRYLQAPRASQNCVMTADSIICVTFIVDTVRHFTVRLHNLDLVAAAEYLSAAISCTMRPQYDP